MYVCNDFSAHGMQDSKLSGHLTAHHHQLRDMDNTSNVHDIDIAGSLHFACLGFRLQLTRN